MPDARRRPDDAPASTPAALIRNACLAGLHDRQCPAARGRSRGGEGIQPTREPPTKVSSIVATPIETVRSMVRRMLVSLTEALTNAVRDSAATTATIVAALRHAGGASRVVSRGTPAPS